VPSVRAVLSAAIKGVLKGSQVEPAKLHKL
jgi:hypothetical protein